MKTLSVCFLFFILLIGLFCIPHFALAEDGFLAGTSKGLMLGISSFLMQIAILFIKLAVFFLRFFILLAGYNGFIEANVVKFGWNIIRDIANMFFIIILLIIAFGTILGLEQYEWKKSLPKLIFAAIFVNFSNVICQLIIDISQVFTITFLNAVAGIASGNFIQMMNFTKVVTFVSENRSDTSPDLIGELIGSGVFAVFFTAIAMATIASYLIVMLYRVVVLWTLMILSPLAFVFSVLPSTKGYATDFWKEFINHVIAAPVMVFFMWLAFATFGNGDIISHIEANNSVSGASLDGGANGIQEETKVSLLEAATLNNLASTLVAIAFLLIGVERVQKLGVKGGDYIQKGLDFGKNVATIATGIKAAQWSGGKAWGGAKAAGGFALNKAPLIGGDAWRRRGTKIAGAASGIASSVQMKRDLLGQKMEKAMLGENPGAGRRTLAFLGGMATLGVLKSGKRADKEAKDWKDWAETQGKRHEEAVSTGHTSMADRKLEATVRLQEEEKKSAAGKENKFAKKKNEILAQDVKLETARVKAAKKSAADAALHDVLLGKKTPAEMEKAVKDAENKAKAKTPEMSMLNIIRQTETLKLKGAKGNRDLEDKITDIRKGVLLSMGRGNEAVALERDLQHRRAEEADKPFMSMTTSDRNNRGKELAEEAKRARTNLTGQALQEKLIELQKESNQLLRVGAKLGPEAFRGIMSAMMEEIHGPGAVDMDGKNAGQRLLEAISLDKLGSATEQDEAQKHFDTKLFGSSIESQSQMAMWQNLINGLAAKGDVKMGGAVSASQSKIKGVPDPRAIEGVPSVYKFVNSENSAEVTKKLDDEKYWASRVETRSLLDLNGYMKVDLVSGKVSGMSKDQQTQLTDLLSTFTDPRNVAEGFSKGFTSKLREQISTGQMDAIQKQLLEVLKDVKNKVSSDVYKAIIDTQFKAAIDRGWSIP